MYKIKNNVTGEETTVQNLKIAHSKLGKMQKDIGGFLISLEELTTRLKLNKRLKMGLGIASIIIEKISNTKKRDK